MLDCSALVRRMENGEIYMGHATWRNFAAMLRHYKFYEFHYRTETVRLSFSGRDGDHERDLRRETVPVLHHRHGSLVHRSGRMGGFPVAKPGEQHAGARPEDLGGSLLSLQQRNVQQPGLAAGGLPASGWPWTSTERRRPRI